MLKMGGLSSDAEFTDSREARQRAAQRLPSVGAAIGHPQPRTGLPMLWKII
jgi:hypothetical protein